MVYRVEGKTRRGRQRARELEKKKNNSARVNEQESTGDGGGRKIYSFFFSRENFVSKKQSKEKIIYSRTIAREKEKVSVSIYFPCFSTLRFFVGGHGGRKRLFTPTLSRLRNAAAVINYPGKSCNDPDIPSISQGGRGSSAIRPIGVSWENRVIDKPRQPRPTFRLRRSSVLLEFSMLAFLVAHRKNLR